VLGVALTALFLSGHLHSVACADEAEGEEQASTASTDFNELKFTQVWGYGSCLQFKGETRGQIPCRYEDKPSIWSIHGIWPTETGTMGPNFCEKVKFDPSLVAPIEPQLALAWYEISEKKDLTDFWTHEWVKHGSCAKALPDFETELKYFTSGLELRKKYDLYSVLKDGGIIPLKIVEPGYELKQINAVLLAAFGTDPYIQCLHTKEGQIHLLAIEICLDRNLTLVSCSRHTTRHLDLEGVLPCPREGPILYNDDLPTPAEDREEL